MHSKARPSTGKSATKKRRQSDDYVSIFDTKMKSKTTSRRPRAGDVPAQPSRSQASKRGLSESGGSPIIRPKRLKAMVSDGRKGANIPGTRDTSAQSSTLPDFSASRPAFRQLEFDRLDNYEINCEIERLSSPSIVQDYGDVLPDLPENLSLGNISTPSVSLLRSNAVTPNFSSEHNDAPPAFPVLRSESSTPDLPSDNHDAPSPQNSRNNSPSHQGATTTWSSNPNSMKTIDFTTEQQLLVPPPTDPYDAFRLFIDDDLLDLIVRETNANAVRVGAADNVKRNSRINNWKVLTKEELMTFLGLLLHTGTIRLNRICDYWKRHYLFNIPCFGQFMSRNRFLLILRCLHFTSETSEEDRLIETATQELLLHRNVKKKPQR
ncbi:unnamed protein product [Arctia plantaginis]|uniref:PiggyBac transposable element-derived protein domain-containing protein n=1 Tax=Arctia plantaginis TaxID=874455 RepID=A0A8S1A6F9_ARCPL|nr:unnamed protein product [Arctia plantaginis]